MWVSAKALCAQFVGSWADPLEVGLLRDIEVKVGGMF